MTIDEILDKLSAQTKLSHEELLKKIEKKQKELAVVSIEGAAQLFAKELGLNLEVSKTKNMEIKDIIGGVKNVNINGRIFQISNINTFKRKDGTEGKVVNLLIGDNSGFMKLVLWDKQTELVSEKIIDVDHAIQVSNALARENSFGDIELSIGKFGSVRSSNEEFLPNADDLLHRYAVIPNQRIFISDIRSGTFEIKGSAVQIFPGKFIFFVCPECGKSLDTNICKDHGEVEPSAALVLNVVIDDGSGDIRVTFFRNIAEQTLGISSKEVAAIAEPERYNLIKEKLLGKELVIQGKVKKNKDFNRFELTASGIKEINPLEESKIILEELEIDNA
jgi:ssDNA-binding replication factor A large subunit